MQIYLEAKDARETKLEQDQRYNLLVAEQFDYGVRILRGLCGPNLCFVPYHGQLSPQRACVFSRA